MVVATGSAHTISIAGGCIPIQRRRAVRFLPGLARRPFARIAQCLRIESKPRKHNSDPFQLSKRLSSLTGFDDRDRDRARGRIVGKAFQYGA